MPSPRKCAPSAKAEVPSANHPSDQAPNHGEQLRGGTLDDVLPASSNLPPIVALGGSAGAIAPLETFFAQVSADSGAAFIVVLHLAPEQESHLASVLQRHTTMPVVQVQEPTLALANHVYVIPPNKHLTVEKGFLYLSALDRKLGKHVAVDVLFRSLAGSHGPRAAAVVLSGMDGDGCIGLKRVKEHGGLTVAQEPQEAEQPGMPRSAIATHMVDWVLPVAEMPGKLIGYFRREREVRLPSEEAPAKSPPPAEANDETALLDILSLLRTRTGSDFSYYKRATVLRRIGRRMQVNGVTTLPDYLQCLDNQPGEASALLQDLLISVTNFFRDRDAFAALEAQVPALFKGKGSDDTLRVWVAGCATGEEAYSVAMLLREHAATLVQPPKLQVFATDLDEAAITAARLGVYPETIVADVSPERLQAFFTHDAHSYRVRAELREIVLFALHDVLKDPPFSRLALVTCRNLLIYLNREAQQRVFDTFHFALQPKGLLFLGVNESIEDVSSLFAPVDKKQRLYRRLDLRRTSPPLAVPPGPPAPGAKQGTFSPPTAAASGTHREKTRTSAIMSAVSAADEPQLPFSWNALHFRVLERYAPPSVIVDSNYQVIHLSEHARRFVELGGGEATLQVLKLVHPMLRLELRAALLRASQAGQEIQVRDIPMEDRGDTFVVNLRVCPADELAPGFLLVIFEQTSSVTPASPTDSDDGHKTSRLQLEEAFERLSEQQRRTAEEHETSVEELKSSNEELQSRNEELGATAEELETSREEHQSINEELLTVNQELKAKLEELAQSNSDLQNLMASTNIATVFLDQELCIQRYTPSAVRLFNLLPVDKGRPLSDLSHRLDYPDITADAEQVLAQRGDTEREVQGPGGGWLLARMQPYLTAQNQVAGVVLTFVDISKRKRAEDDLRASEERFRATTDSIPQIVWRCDAQGNAEFFNQRWYNYTGTELKPQLVPEIIEHFIHPEDRQITFAAFEAAQKSKQPYMVEHRIRRHDGEYRWFLVRGEPELDPLTGESVRWFGTSTDITERKRTEEDLAATAERLRLALETTRSGTWDWDMTTNEVLWSREHNVMFDLPVDQLRGNLEQGLDRIHPDDRALIMAEVQAAVREQRDFHAEVRSVHHDGSVHWIVNSGRASYDAAGGPTRMIGVSRDITKRKLAEETLRESEERFRLANFHAPYPVMLHTNAGEVIQVNDSWTHQTGYMAEELATLEDWIVRAYPEPVAQEEPRRLLAELPEHFGTISRKGCRIRCADGDERIWDMHSSLLGLRSDGQVLRITTAMDVTERHQGEVALRAAKEDAERANLAKSQFLSRMSHELRTPLNAILGFGQVLELGSLPETETQAVAHILKGGKILLSLIDEVLDLARVEAGKLDLVLVPVALEKLAQDCVGFVEKLAKAGGIQCTVDFLPACAVPVLADEARLRQVLFNLLSNAIKYNHPGGRVTLRCESRPGNRARLLVEDTGSGISPEGLARLFVPFERLGQELGEVEGTGLGLVVSQQLAEAMGGRLGATSRLGRGSTFWVELPVATEDAPLPGTDPGVMTAPLSRRQEDLPPVNVLYVEDNESNRQVLSAVVERLRPSWRLLLANDGVSGLEQAREHRPDVILLDLQLPGKKGDVVLKELRDTPDTSQIPVLVLSADATVGSQERLLAAGATAYLPKPFVVAELLAKVDQLLQSSPP